MNNFKRLLKNINGKDFIVGDIHGSFEMLMKKLEEVNFDKTKDRLISVGDIINKGEDSEAAIKLLDQEWFYPVIGNHEWMMIEFFDYGNYYGTLKKYGGKWFLNKEREEQKNIVDKLKKVPVAMELEVGDKVIGIVHAEVPYNSWETFVNNLGCKNNENMITDAVWSRVKIDSMDDYEVEGISEVYVGHTIVENPIKLGNVNYIDTGAFYYGNMTLINLTERYS